MIDLHCHILPSLDDGARDLEQSLEMAQNLIELGVTAVAASPHTGGGPGGDVRATDARAEAHALNTIFAAKDVPLKILPNSEHYLGPEFLERLSHGDVVTVGGEGRWLLVEMPWSPVPKPEELLFRIRSKGYNILLAHPERVRYFDMDILKRLSASGVRMQIEAGSLLGAYGETARKNVEAIYKENLAHVLATDLHSPEDLIPWLSEAYSRVQKLVGQKRLDELTVHNPQLIIDDADAERVI
ncbi:hypothetical protein KAI87_01965 [Myxococcota bacterium]|nr:hypothetical protein [Myxococcota bacterium]